MKKIFLLLLAMFICVVSAYAQSFEVDGISYSVTKEPSEEAPGEVEVTQRNDGYEGDIVIPNEVDYADKTYRVTAIGDRAFRYRSSLSSVIIGNYVTYIGDESFRYCDGLTSVILYNSVTNICENAFWNCSKLETLGVVVTDYAEFCNNKIHFNQVSCTILLLDNEGNEIREFIIPEDVTIIDEYTFWNCRNLTSVTIPEGVTSIGNGAFSGCIGLNSIIIPNSVTSIGNGAFDNCNSLISINIGDGVTSIGNRAFIGCRSLTSITIGNNVSSIGDGTFYNCSGLSSITIGNSLSSIGNETFYNCKELTSIVIPGGVKSIGSNTFGNCSKLNNVKIDVTDYSEFCNNAIVAKLNDEIYQLSRVGSIQLLDVDGNEITEYVIPEDVTTVGSNAFKNCRNLTSITIPNSVANIGENVFYGCSGLKQIISKISSPYDINAFNSFDAILIVPKGVRADYKSVNGWYFTYVFEEGETIYNKELTDEQGLKYTLMQADDNSFYYYLTGHSNELNTEIDIPADLSGCPVRTIGYSAFSRCTKLSSITIPDNVTTIYGSAFTGCSSLISISLPTTLTDIGNNAFENCGSLRSIIIPENVLSIGNRTFANCSSLSSIYSIALIPPTIESDTFEGIASQATLYVYADVIDTYEKNNYWAKLSNVSSFSQIPCAQPVFIFSNYQLTITSSTPDAAIYYTLDGSNPTISSARYTAPIPFAKNGTVRAIAVCDGYDSSMISVFDKNDFKVPAPVVEMDENFMITITCPDSDVEGMPDTRIFYSLNQSSNSFVSSNYKVWSEYTSPFQLTEASYLRAYVVRDGWNNWWSTGDLNQANLRMYNFYTEYYLSPPIASWDSSAQLFTLKHDDPEATIYYTLDGTPPSSSNGTRYTEPIAIERSLTIQSIAIKAGKIDSQIITYVTNVNTDFEYEGLHYRLIANVLSDEVELFDGTQSEGDVSIPDKVKTQDGKEYIVTRIVNDAFNGCTSLSSVTIPNSVTSIGEDAFYGCTGLMSAKIGDGVISIGKRAFCYCENLTSVKMGRNIKTIGEYAFSGCGTLASVNLRGQLISIGEAAFSGCTSLSSITIPNGVTTIGGDAFYDCDGLTSAIIGDGVISIGNRSFYSCENLASVKMGSDISTIGESAFYGCRSLTSVVLGDQLASIGNNAFSGCISLSSIVIPNSVTTIGSGAFRDCSGLMSILIGNGVTSLKSETFQGCSSLTTLMIPNSVTSIGDGYSNSIYRNGKFEYNKSGVFNGCSSLSSVSIGSGVLYIGSYAFIDCNKLISVEMGENVNRIGSGAFSGCSSLTSITLHNQLDSIGQSVFPVSMKSIELSNSFTVVPDNLFSGNNFQYIKLGNNVKSIGKNAFGSSNPVIEIETSAPPTIASDAFPNVDYLGEINVIVPDAKAETAYQKAAVWKEMTFSNQSNVSEVTVDTPGDLSFELITECNMTPAKVVGLKVNGTINDDDFRQMLVNMKSLLRLDLSDCSITEIPEGAMEGKTQLQELTLPTRLQSIGQNAFKGCIGLQKLTLHAELHSISQGAFQNCTSLRELDLQVRTIGQNAFSNCSGLQELNLQAQTIGQDAFSNCSSLQKLSLQTGLQTIGQSAFEGCGSLTELLELPSTVTSIGESAFVGTNLSSIKFSSALNTIGENAFYNVPIKQKLVLPNNVNSVGASAFAGTKIEGLQFPDGLKSIGDYAFERTPIQGHVSIPDGVTYLGTGAFRNSQLSTVFLPNSIPTLSESIFQGCPNLNLVYVPDNYTGLATSAFDGCGALTVMRLSANLTSMGEYAFQNTPLEYVKIPSQVEVLPRGVLKNCQNLESLSLPASLKSVEAEALTGCTGLRNLSVEALTPPVISGMNAIRGINTDLCLISIPTSSYRQYVLAEYWGQFVQMRNDIAVETEGNGKIAFESVNEEEEGEEESEVKTFGLRRAAALAKRRTSQLAEEEEDTMTYANSGSSVYVPQQGKVRFFIIPAEGEEILSATLDGEDIMPYIVDGVYTATADKKNAKLVVKFSGSGQGSAVLAGDVNGDGDVSVTDVGCVINYILEQIPDPFIYAAADMNGDESISVTDVGYIINYILNDGFTAVRSIQKPTYAYGMPMLTQDAGGYALTLDGADAFIGFQMDILVPKDGSDFNVQLAETGTDHQMAWRRLSSGHYRIVCYSPTNEAFPKGLANLLTIATEGNVTITDLRFTTKSLNEVRFADVDAAPTSIAGVTDLMSGDIKIYTLDGRLYRTVHAREGENPLNGLKPGIYLINERKVIIR